MEKKPISLAHVFAPDDRELRLALTRIEAIVPWLAASDRARDAECVGSRDQGFGRLRGLMAALCGNRRPYASLRQKGFGRLRAVMVDELETARRILPCQGPAFETWVRAYAVWLARAEWHWSRGLGPDWVLKTWADEHKMLVLDALHPSRAIDDPVLRDAVVKKVDRIREHALRQRREVENRGKPWQLRHVVRPPAALPGRLGARVDRPATDPAGEFRRRILESALIDGLGRLIKPPTTLASAIGHRARAVRLLMGYWRGTLFGELLREKASGAREVSFVRRGNGWTSVITAKTGRRIPAHILLLNCARAVLDSTPVAEEWQGPHLPRSGWRYMTTRTWRTSRAIDAGPPTVRRTNVYFDERGASWHWQGAPRVIDDLTIEIQVDARDEATTRRRLIEAGLYLADVAKRLEEIDERDRVHAFRQAFPSVRIGEEN